MMNFKTIFMTMLLLTGALFLNAQIDEPWPEPAERKCASLENIMQECNREGTVDITYQVSNNSRCDARGVTITTNGIGQSYPLNIPSQTVSATQLTFSGATPGTVVCFDIILHSGDGRECCRERDCIRVEDPCESRPCASLENVKQECNRGGTVDITYQVSNNSLCDAAGVTITTNGIGQSYPLNIPSQTVSATPITYSGATPGTVICFDIILFGRDGRECCRDRECIRVEDPCDKPCASLENVKQECNREGTVDLTYQVSNNSECDATGVTITSNGVGQSYPISIASQTVSATPITFSGAALGSVVCFDIILHGPGGRECCRDRDCIRVIDKCCELEAELVSTGGCPPNAWARIIVSGGTAPYTYSAGPSIQPGFPGNFILTGLSSGTQTATFTDANGCTIDVTFTIPPVIGSTCTDFLAVDTDQNDGDFTMTSAIAATLTLNLEAYCIPDRVFVSINGGPDLVLSAGDDACDGNNACNGDNSQACAEICVQPCDEISFRFEGDWCDDDCFSTPVATAWRFRISDCVLGCGNGGSRIVSETNPESINIASRSEFDPEAEAALLSGVSESVNVFPNPVTNVLNINNFDHLIDCHTARIINSAGQVIHSVDVSNLDQLRIDASGFPKGLYAIEFTDDSGHVIVERFTKLE